MKIVRQILLFYYYFAFYNTVATILLSSLNSPQTRVKISPIGFFDPYYTEIFAESTGATQIVTPICVNPLF